MSDLLNRLESLSPKKLALAVLELEQRVSRLQRAAREPIAVIGIGCRFPGDANSPDEYWELLEGGRDAIGEVPRDRWDADAWYNPDPDTPGKCCTRAGGFLSRVDLFDAGHFNISPREAARMDPQQRMLLEVCWEALEHAAVAPDRLTGTLTGVYFGLSTADYYQVIRACGVEETDGYMATGSAHSVAAGRISYVLGLQGPAVAVDTACSSSLVAVHLACRALRSGDCDLALAGGANVMLSPEITVALSRAHMLAPDGRCKAFDARADGFVRSEGCGMVVLKRLSDALAAGDRVLAVVRGSALNQDGRSNGLTAPNGAAQEALMRRALDDAGLEPSDVDYLETHGTGTALGDPIEAGAIASVFGGRRSTPLRIGSAKTNLGHLEASAGIAGFIKAVLAIERGHIPPHLHFQKLNPHIDFGGLAVEIPAGGAAWLRKRVAGVSSFGFGGTNAHVVLEEAPAMPAAGRSAGPWTLPLSARTPGALRELAARYHALLAANSSLDLADVCHTALRGRAQFAERAVITAATREEMMGQLSAVASGGAAPAGDVPTAQSQGRRVVSLPTYPFERKRFWLDPPAGPEQTAEPEHYQLQWQEKELDSRGAAEWIGSGEAKEILARSGRLNERLERLSGAYLQRALAVNQSLSPRYRRYREYESKVLADRGESTLDTRTEAQLIAGEFPDFRGWIDMVTRCGEALPSVLSGATDPLELLFPRASLDKALDVYEGSPAARLLQQTVAESVAEAARKAGRKIRILEIGGGTGGTTSSVAPAVKETCAEYVFTDISPLFTARAQERFRAYPFFQYRVLDIERTPESQGFVSGRFDVVIAANVLHATADLRAAVENARSLLAPDGALVLLESTRPLRSIDVTFGLTDGWWRFTDTGLRPDYPLLDRAGWAALLNAVGFESNALPEEDDVVQAVITARRRAASGRWVVIGDAGLAASLSAQGLACEAAEDVRAVDLGGRRVLYRACGDPLQIALDVSHVVERLANDRLPRSLWIATTGAQSCSGPPTHPSAASAWGFGRTVAVEHPELWGGLIDLDPLDTTGSQAALLARELTRGDWEDQIAFRAGRRFAARLARMEAPAPAAVRFDPAAAYLITGGLGGLGLKAAQWLVDHGARYLVLVGRGAPAQAAQLAALDRLRESGATIRPVQADVADRAAMQRLFSEFGGSAPALKGVIHTAAAFRRNEVAHMDRESAEAVLRAKTTGASILDELTRPMRLDFFCLFSSTAAFIGSRTMGHYAAANAFLDALAHSRSAAGFPAISIGWGTWDEMKGATEEDRRRYRAMGLVPMNSSRALDWLGRLLAPDAPPHAVVAAIDWRALKPALEVRRSLPLLSGIGESRPESRPAPVQSKPPARVEEPLPEFLSRQVREVLQLPTDEQLGEDSDLFTLGLDSLASIELTGRLQQRFGVSIPSTELFQCPNLRTLTEFVAQQIGDGSVTVAKSFTPAAISLTHRLSAGQQAIWVAQEMDPTSPAYNCTLAARIQPRPDPGILDRAFQMVLERHPALRTGIAVHDGEPECRISPSLAIRLQCKEVQDATRLQLRIQEEAQRAFDMAAPPLLRATLLEEGEKADSVLVLTAHHLVFDAYSGKVLLSDLARAYAALAADSSPGWTAPEANFPDFVSDECTWLQSADADEAWRYWQVQLSGLPDLELPGETEDVSFNLAGDSIPFHIDAASAGRLAALAAAHRTTPFTVLLTAWQSALHEWTGQPDLSVAVPVSMRDDRRFAAAVGNFVNIVLMRSRAGRPVPFEARLAAARETVLDGLKHKAFPFTDLVDRLRFRRRGLVLPQARVTFNLLQATPAGEFPLFDWRVSPLEVRQQEGHYDVSLALWESAGALTGWIKYRTGAVQPREIRDLAAKLQGVIEEVTCGSLVGIPAREELEW